MPGRCVIFFDPDLDGCYALVRTLAHLGLDPAGAAQRWVVVANVGLIIVSLFFIVGIVYAAASKTTNGFAAVVLLVAVWVAAVYIAVSGGAPDGIAWFITTFVPASGRAS